MAGWPGDPAKCKNDAVKVGSVCMDKYEASVWEVPNATTTNKGLVNKIQKGSVKYIDLVNGGAIQRGLTADDYTCANNGQDCANKIYAVSLSDLTVPVKPSAYITWFQAQEACTNSRKRLPSNACDQDRSDVEPHAGQSHDQEHHQDCEDRWNHRHQPGCAVAKDEQEGSEDDGDGQGEALDQRWYEILRHLGVQRVESDRLHLQFLQSRVSFLGCLPLPANRSVETFEAKMRSYFLTTP